MAQVINSKGVTVLTCPKCGYDEFSVSCRMSGRGEYIIRQDGLSGDNTQLHDCLKYTLGKQAKCANCGKRVGEYQDP